jgi:hypothetical protein
MQSRGILEEISRKMKDSQSKKKRVIYDVNGGLELVEKIKLGIDTIWM